MKRKINETVTIASYRDARDARAVLAELRDAGYSEKKIGVLTSDSDGEQTFRSLDELGGDKSGKGAALGAAVGAGGGSLWALGIAAGALPAIGPVVGGGILGAVAASAGVGAATGGAVGALVGAGLTDEQAAYAQEELRKGHTIVAVKDEKLDQLRHILDRRPARYYPSSGDAYPATPPSI